MNFYQNSPFTFLEGSQINFDSSWIKELESSKSYKLIYLNEGEITLSVSGNSIPLKKQFLYLIPSNQLINFHSQSTGEIFHCSFECSIPKQLDLCAHRKSFESLSSENPVLSQELFNRLISPDLDDYERSSILQLLLCPFIKQSQSKSQSKALNRLQVVFNYIDKNISYSPRIEDLAKLLDLDKNYFSSFFRKNMGISPGQYIQQRKILVACTMLENHSSVSKISEELDFYDTAHFCHIFKKEMGETPKNYLKRINVSSK